MNPMRGSTHRAAPGIDLALRLVLVVLLALAPLLSTAGVPASIGATGQAGSAQMPCHPNPPLTAPSAAADACPHCDAGTPVAHCDCCDQAAPAGLAPMSANAHFDCGYTDRYRAIRPHLPPHLAVERLYRPPIPTA